VLSAPKLSGLHGVLSADATSAVIVSPDPRDSRRDIETRGIIVYVCSS